MTQLVHINETRRPLIGPTSSRLGTTEIPIMESSMRITKSSKSSPSPLSKKPEASGSKKSATKDQVSLSTKNGNTLWSLATTGYRKAVAQNFTASSISLSLRLGSRQVDGLVGTGIAGAMGAAGIGLGFAAAGLRAAGGTEKLIKAAKKRDMSKALDGLKDYGSASVLGLTCAGMWAARRIALPAAAGFETFRGGYNFAAGLLTGDKQRQARGVYDGIRAAGRTARALKRVSPFLKTAGLILAPVAGVLQARKGFKTLGLGLKKDNNKLELRGAMTIASAIGTTMLLTGVAAMPGMAIFGTAQFISTIYRMSGTVRNVLDPVIDKAEPTAHRAADGIRNIKAKATELIEKFPNPFVWSPTSEDDTKGEKVVVEEEEEYNDPSVWYNECFLAEPDEDHLVPDSPDSEPVDQLATEEPDLIEEDLDE